MSGQLDFGEVLNNAGAARIGMAKAFEEGLQFRASGTAAAKPLTGNPHEVGNEEHDSWDIGWAVADTASPSAIAQSAAPGVAIPTNAVAA